MMILNVYRDVPQYLIVLLFGLFNVNILFDVRFINKRQTLQVRVIVKSVTRIIL